MSALAKIEPQSVSRFSADQVDLIKRTIAKGATDDELRLFMYQAERTGLDPLARQIYAVKRWDSQAQREVMAIQTSIDGFRLIAERSGKYAGQLGPYWCGKNGEWVDVWTTPEPPTAARVGILRSDFKEPLWGVARYESYAQKKKDGTPTRMWQAMADVMISKCAEALGLRKAFPQELSGLYTNDEMEQAQTAPETPPKQVTIEQPKTVAPPHDPQTGEIGPHKLEYDTWVTFGQKMIGVTKDQSAAVKDTWMIANADTVKAMKKEAPKIHKRMLTAMGVVDQGDPEAFLKLVKEECAALKTIGDLHTYEANQADAFAQLFPPDVAAAKKIIANRIAALAHA